MSQRKTPDDYNHLAPKRGFTWLGPDGPNVRTKTTWQCQAGHQCPATYNKVQQKRGCPFCAGKPPKKPANYKRLAKNSASSGWGRKCLIPTRQPGGNVRPATDGKTALATFKAGRDVPLAPRSRSGGRQRIMMPWRRSAILSG